VVTASDPAATTTPSAEDLRPMVIKALARACEGE
jgi:hypothetical protein